MAAAARQIKPIEWSKLQERIAPALKPKFNSFKSKSDAIMVNYLKAKEKKLTVDWSYYQQAIANKSLVKNFETKFNALKIPSPIDTKSDTLEQNIKKDNERVKQFIKDSEESMADTLAEVNRLNSLPPFEQMTQEDIYFQFKSLRPDYEKYPAWPHVENPTDMVVRPR